MSDDTGWKTRDWAALVYLAADNDLSDAGLQDVQELCDARPAHPGDGDSVKSVFVGVEIDTKGDHEGSIRYEITDEGYRTVLQRLPERDTGDPKSLIDFLRWGFGRFRAKRYLAVIWGHGEGFKLARGVAYDDTGGSLDIPAIAQALASVGTGSTDSRKLEVLGFDACLMSMVEIAYNLRHCVKVVVGSEQTEPGDGWPYDRVSEALRFCENGKDLGRRIVDLYIQRCERDLIPNVTQSAIDLEKIEEVVDALGELGRALVNEMSSSGNLVTQARRETQGFAAADYVDLQDLCEQLDHQKLTSLKKATTHVLAAAREATIHYGTFGPAVARARGLSVWFPTNPVVFDKYRDEYRSLAAEPCAGCNTAVVPPDRCPNGCRVDPPATKLKTHGLLDWIAFLDAYRAAQPASTFPVAAISPPAKIGASPARAGHPRSTPTRSSTAKGGHPHRSRL